MHSEYTLYIQLALFLGFLIPIVCFFYTQYQTLQLIQPQFRRLHPGQVWFQLIPMVGLIWQFFVIARLSDSIRNQLAEPSDGSLFGEEEPRANRPTFRLGIIYAALFCVAAFPAPFVKVIAAAAGIVFWLAYWIELNRYRNKIKSRSVVAG